MSDWKVKLLQRSVARDIADSEMPYDRVLGIIEEWRLFEGWSDYEINNRLIDTEALAEIIHDEICGERESRDIREIWGIV